MNISPKAIRFLAYWRRYRDDIADVATAARRNALKDGREIVCLNDVEAAWSKLIGPLSVSGS